MIRKHHQLAALSLAGCLSLALSIGCGGDGDDESADKAPEAGTTRITGTITVPSTFDATPASLAVVGFHSLPPTTMPDAIFSVAISPVAIDASTPFQLDLSTTETGSFYISFALFVAGGGTMMPVDGVDYVGMTPQAHDLSGGTVDIGDVALVLSGSGS